MTRSQLRASIKICAKNSFNQPESTSITQHLSFWSQHFTRPPQPPPIQTNCHDWKNKPWINCHSQQVKKKNRIPDQQRFQNSDTKQLPLKMGRVPSIATWVFFICTSQLPRGYNTVGSCWLGWQKIVQVRMWLSSVKLKHLWNHHQPAKHLYFRALAVLRWGRTFKKTVTCVTQLSRGDELIHHRLGFPWRTYRWSRSEGSILNISTFGDAEKRSPKVV